MAEYHARLSPSGAHRWMACPGSVAAERDITEAPSEYADEGTVGHILAADCLAKDRQAATFIGEKIFPGGNRAPILLTEELAEAVQCYVDVVRDRVAAYELAGARSTLLIEQKVPISHITGENGATGTADAIIIAVFSDRTVLDVIDLKLGRGVQVSPEWNPQMLMYASGAIEEHSAFYDFDEANLIVHQPRLSITPAEWSTSAADIIKWVDEEARPAAIKAGGNEFNPGDKQCRFCKAKPCAALTKFVEQTIGGDFEAIDMDSPARMTNEELGRVYPTLSLVEQWAKAVLARIEFELRAGRPVPGTKLVQGRKGARKWSSEEEAEALLKSMRLKVAEMYNLALISPVQADKLLSKEKPRLWKKIEGLIIQREGSPSVVDESDKRPALAVSKIEDDFNEISE